MFIVTQSHAEIIYFAWFQGAGFVRNCVKVKSKSSNYVETDLAGQKKRMTQGVPKESYQKWEAREKEE